MTDFAILSQNVGAELRLRQSDCDLRSENKILSWWDWKCYLSEFERVWIAICCYLLPAPAPSSGGSVQVLSVRSSSPLAAVNTFQILSFHWVILSLCLTVWLTALQGWGRMRLCCLSLTGKSVIWIYLLYRPLSSKYRHGPFIFILKPSFPINWLYQMTIRSPAPSLLTLT